MHPFRPRHPQALILLAAGRGDGLTLLFSVYPHHVLADVWLLSPRLVSGTPHIRHRYDPQISTRRCIRHRIVVDYTSCLPSLRVHCHSGLPCSWHRDGQSSSRGSTPLCTSAQSARGHNVTDKSGKPDIRPNQKTMFPIVLFRFTAGSLPSAIIGSCAIYHQLRPEPYMPSPTCMRNKYGLIFLVTTAMTSS